MKKSRSSHFHQEEEDGHAESLEQMDERSVFEELMSISKKRYLKLVEDLEAKYSSPKDDEIEIDIDTFTICSNSCLGDPMPYDEYLRTSMKQAKKLCKTKMKNITRRKISEKTERNERDFISNHPVTIEKHLNKVAEISGPNTVNAKIKYPDKHNTKFLVPCFIKLEKLHVPPMPETVKLNSPLACPFSVESSLSSNVKETDEMKNVHQTGVFNSLPTLVKAEKNFCDKLCEKQKPTEIETKTPIPLDNINANGENLSSTTPSRMVKVIETIGEKHIISNIPITTDKHLNKSADIWNSSTGNPKTKYPDQQHKKYLIPCFVKLEKLPPRPETMLKNTTLVKSSEEQKSPEIGRKPFYNAEIKSLLSYGTPPRVFEVIETTCAKPKQGKIQMNDSFHIISSQCHAATRSDIHVESNVANSEVSRYNDNHASRCKKLSKPFSNTISNNLCENPDSLSLAGIEIRETNRTNSNCTSAQNGNILHNNCSFDVGCKNDSSTFGSRESISKALKISPNDVCTMTVVKEKSVSVSSKELIEKVILSSTEICVDTDGFPKTLSNSPKTVNPERRFQVSTRSPSSQALPNTVSNHSFEKPDIASFLAGIKLIDPNLKISNGTSAQYINNSYNNQSGRKKYSNSFGSKKFYSEAPIIPSNDDACTTSVIKRKSKAVPSKQLTKKMKESSSLQERCADTDTSSKLLSNAVTTVKHSRLFEVSSLSPSSPNLHSYNNCTSSFENSPRSFNLLPKFNILKPNKCSRAFRKRGVSLVIKS